MLVIWKRSGESTQVRFLSGCLVWSLVISLGLTVLVNLLLWLL
jgi:hypothetical protein